MSVTIGTQRVNVDYFLVALSVKSVNKILSISGCEPHPPFILNFFPELEVTGHVKIMANL